VVASRHNNSAAASFYEHPTKRGSNVAECRLDGQVHEGFVRIHFQLPAYCSECQRKGT
jgi:hypothetical protein